LKHGGGRIKVIEQSIQHYANIVSTFLLMKENLMSARGSKQVTEDAKMEAKARAVRLQRDLEMQLETTTDPAERWVIQSRITNLKELIRTISNIK